MGIQILQLFDNKQRERQLNMAILIHVSKDRHVCEELVTEAYRILKHPQPDWLFKFNALCAEGDSKTIKTQAVTLLKLGVNESLLVITSLIKLGILEIIQDAMPIFIESLKNSFDRAGLTHIIEGVARTAFQLGQPAIADHITTLLGTL